MENLGSLATLLAFCVALYATVACVVGRLKNKPFLIVSGERAVYSVWVLMTIASGILVYALMTGDFRFAYVAEHSNRAMPTLYKFAAWWGGQEGSLLFWSWLLLHLRRGRGLHESPQAPRHDAVGNRRADFDPDLLPDPEHLRSQPVPDAGAR